MSISSHAHINRIDGNIACKIICANETALNEDILDKNSTECAETNSKLLSPLRQRSFDDVTELIETRDVVILNVNKISGITFAFHAEDIRNSECSCEGIHRFYVTRCTFADRTSRML